MPCKILNCFLKWKRQNYIQQNFNIQGILLNYNSWKLLYVVTFFKMYYPFCQNITLSTKLYNQKFLLNVFHTLCAYVYVHLGMGALISILN